MKFYLLIILSFFSHLLRANMASPYSHTGTISAQAFASKNVRVLNENLDIFIYNELPSAQITAEYEIEIDSVGLGKYIPLLFLAENYRGEFQAWVDGQPIEWKPVPPEYIYDDFPGAFKGSTVDIKWNTKGYRPSPKSYNFSDLKYFEVPLSKKRHTIKVSYTALFSEDRSYWVKKYELSYALSPSRYWQSFEKINLTISTEDSTADYSINLNKTGKKISPNTYSYLLDTLPEEDLLITYQPAISNTAHFFIALNPGGMAWIVAILFFIIHTLVYKPFSAAPIKIRFSFPLFMAYALISVCIMGTYLYSFQFIDDLIGQHAGQYHGYYFFVVIFYPVLVLVYAMLHFWLVKLLIMMRATKR